MKISEHERMKMMLHPRYNPDEYTTGSGKKVAWICCECGRYFEKTPNHVYWNLKKDENPCIFCSGKVAAPEESLLILRKEYIDKYFDFEENIKRGIIPCNLTVNSNRKIYIFCKEHNFRCQQIVSDFSAGHIACKICNNKMASIDNNLQVKFPEKANEVNREKYKEMYNEEFDPYKIHPYSSKKLPFDCNFCGEIHIKEVAVRVSQYSGCPKFNAIYQTSKPQQILWCYLKEVIPDLEIKYPLILEKKGNKIIKFEFDLYSAKYNLAIEYDGYRHNKNRVYADEKKNKYCKENGINLIRIREDSSANIDTFGFPVIWCRYDSNLIYLQNVLREIHDIFKNKMKMDDIASAMEKFNFDINEIFNKIHLIESGYSCKNSIGILAPGLIQILAPEEKKYIYTIPAKSSSRKLFCRCKNPKCGYKFNRTPKNLIISKGRCPKCKYEIDDIMDPNSTIKPWMRKVSYNKSLSYKRPDIAKFYSDKNMLRSDEISYGSNYHAIFNCPYEDCKAEYTAIVKKQTQNGCKCKICGRKAILYDKN